MTDIVTRWQTFVKRILISRRTIVVESVMEYTVEKRDLFYELPLFSQQILSFKKNKMMQ